MWKAMKSHFLRWFTLKKLDVLHEVTNHSIGIKLDIDCGLKKHHGVMGHLIAMGCFTLQQDECWESMIVAIYYNLVFRNLFT